MRLEQATARGWAIRLAATGPVFAVVTVLAGLDRGRHIYLRSLAHPEVGILITAVMLGIAAALGITKRGQRDACIAASLLVAASSALAWILILVAGAPFRSTGSEVVASSLGYEIVAYHYGSALRCIGSS